MDQFAGVPVGTVIAYAGAVETEDQQQMMLAQGWMPCDGRTLQARDYPHLYVVLGTGQGYEDREHFAVPDYRTTAFPGDPASETRPGSIRVTYLIRYSPGLPMVRPGRPGW